MRLDRQCMQPGFQFTAQRFIDETMALQPGFVSKVFRNDFDPIMGFAPGRGAGMAGMQMTLVRDGQSNGLKFF